MAYVVTSMARNLSDAARLDGLRRDCGLAADVTVTVTSEATAGDVRWVAWKVDDTRVQALVDALTFDGFADPVPAHQVTLADHNVETAGSAEEADVLVDGASLAVFLRG